MRLLCIHATDAGPTSPADQEVTFDADDIIDIVVSSDRPQARALAESLFPTYSIEYTDKLREQTTGDDCVRPSTDFGYETASASKPETRSDVAERVWTVVEDVTVSAHETAVLIMHTDSLNTLLERAGDDESAEKTAATIPHGGVVEFIAHLSKDGLDIRYAD